MQGIKLHYFFIIISIFYGISNLSIANDNESAYSNLLKGNYNKAIEKYSEQIKLNQEYAPVYFNRALAYMHLENYRSAINDLNKVVELDSKNSDAFYTLTLAYTKLGEYQNALANIEKALEINPTNSNYTYSKANIYYILEDDDNSIIAYNRTLELDPNNAMAYYGRAVAFTYKKETSKAKEDFNKFLAFKDIPQLYIDEANRMLEAIKIAEEYR